MQGSGGLLGQSRKRVLGLMDTLQRRAQESAPLGVYEPIPGHVRVYPDYSYAGHGDGVDVSLIDCKVTVAAYPGDERPIPATPALPGDPSGSDV